MTVSLGPPDEDDRHRRSAPESEGALCCRALGLEGLTLGEVARELGLGDRSGGPRGKGRVGELLEMALGATGGAAALRDFPRLGVELKSVPVSEKGLPLESTHVCVLPLRDLDEASWETSWVRAKLARVLFVPVVTPEGSAWEARRIGRPVVWSPTPAQEAVLRADFEEIVGLIAVGRIEDVSAHVGRYLQLRPKARDGRPAAVAFGPDGEPVPTVPRGFYLRRRFVGAILRDPAALPEVEAGRTGSPSSHAW